MQTRYLLSSLRLPCPRLLRLYYRTMSTRTYRDAIEHLNSLQSNAATIEASRASGGRLAQFAIPETKEYLQRIGYEVRIPDALFLRDFFTDLTARRIEQVKRDTHYWDQRQRLYLRLR